MQNIRKWNMWKNAPGGVIPLSLVLSLLEEESKIYPWRQVYLFDAEAITYVNAILWVVTEPALWVIRLLPILHYRQLPCCCWEPAVVDISSLEVFTLLFALFLLLTSLLCWCPRAFLVFMPILAFLLLPGPAGVKILVTGVSMHPGWCPLCCWHPWCVRPLFCF